MDLTEMPEQRRRKRIIAYVEPHLYEALMDDFCIEYDVNMSQAINKILDIWLGFDHTKNRTAGGN